MFSKALLVGAFAAFAAAQSTVLTFTHVPNPVTDGEAQALTFATNDTTTPVTIILRKGASNDLQTVSTLTTSATDGQYIWTPSTSLADGDDYALEIKQGSQLNYFGPFAIQGQSATTSSSSSAASTSAYAAITGAGNGTAIASTSATANVTTTTVAPVVPVSAGSLSAGTGTALPRNTTMSIATLTSGASATMTGTQTGTQTGTMSGASNTAADTSGAGFQTATASASGTAASSSSSGASDLKVNGALALVFGAIAAALFLH